MAYFAELNDDNEVTRVVVADVLQWCQTRLGGRWLTTSYNATVRKNYAGIGYTYRQEIDAFTPPQPIYNLDLDTQTGRWEFPTGTDVIYMLIASTLAVPLSRQLYLLIDPSTEGMYCGVIPHKTRDDVVLLQLRTTDVVPVALAADPAPLASMLDPYVKSGLLTQTELDSLVVGVSSLAGKEVSIQTLIPPSWQPYVRTKDEATALGWI